MALAPFNPTYVDLSTYGGVFSVGGLSSNSWALVDFVIGDVSGDGVGQRVDFPGEGVVFPVHLCSEVVDPRIHIGVKIVNPLVETVYSLV